MENTATVAAPLALEELQYILALPVPDKWMGYHKAPHMGACPHCGQMVAVYVTKTAAEASELAALACSCPGAAAYQREVAMAERKAQALASAQLKIAAMFGEGAQYSNKDSVSEEKLQVLLDVVGLVYDKHLGKTVMALSETIKAVIGRNNKGNITIERKDAASEKSEVNLLE